MKSDVFEVIEKFQDYLTENRKNLQNHCGIAEENGCNWDTAITVQRLDDLFMIKYRLEQLLSKAGYEDLCTLAAFNEGVREELEKL